jgi:hypothetical protein
MPAFGPATRDSLSETVLESTHGWHNLIDTFEGSSDNPPKMERLDQRANKFDRM